MLYTSGSTGVPKGVMLEHGDIAWDRTTNLLTDKSRVAQYAGYGTVYIIGEEMRLDFESLQKYIDDEGITNAFITTQRVNPSQIQKITLHFAQRRLCRAC